MRKVMICAVSVLTMHFLYAGETVKSIRGVEFEPRSMVSVEGLVSIDIPDSWARETLPAKGEGKVPAHIFSDRNPSFAPSVMIIFEDDAGNDFDAIRKKYAVRVFGDKPGGVRELGDLYTHFDPKASRTYALYGPNIVAGTSFLCFFNYKELKKTVVVGLDLVYAEKFTDEEWNYITVNALYILTSLRRL